jgi:hypothetical protein
VALRAIAELIGRKLGMPVRPVPTGDAEAHFGWLATIVGTDAPASSACHPLVPCLGAAPPWSARRP